MLKSRPPGSAPGVGVGSVPSPEVTPGPDDGDGPRDLTRAVTAQPDSTNRWEEALPWSYREEADPRDLASDLAALQRYEADPGPVGLRVDFRTTHGVLAEVAVPDGLAPDTGLPVLAVVVTPGPALELSRVVPVFEQLGFRVIDAEHWPVADLRLHHVRLRLAADGVSVADAADRWAAAFEATWSGRAPADALGRLVTHAGLTWHQVALVRGLTAHRLQVDHYPLEAVADALVRHPRVAHDLVELFGLRFDPDRRNTDAARDLVEALTTECDALPRIDDDRILRGLLHVTDAVVRTTWFGRSDGLLAVKFDPHRIPDLPDPVPAHEAWIHGPVPSGGWVRGVHLRAGDVARGGLRWSDRPHDLRAEVLDLMRTQVTKNAPIVPTGAKGGFVVDGAAVADAYDVFVGSLLDLTDDRDDAGGVVPAAGRLDGDDTYLVVAADRGTATFSDRANALAIERGFWLGDAFASGGSNGYDHKELGVTARGAWEAALHHFVGLGIDPRRDDVTAVGVGDLSGDVFGNFMIRSPHLRLVAAFDHRHVFVDPDPDGPISFAERTRLAALDRSSWGDYDLSLLSPGGFVVPRTQKLVPLGPEARRALRIDDDEVEVASLIRSILGAPIDLLFFGGIGTFVRARAEEEATLDDRTNSELRVEAEDLRARVLVEGANLAVTQRARVAYSRRGGRVNRDAIDNAAGVDTSDHEVNLKILLDLARRSGEIDDAERAELLEAQTDAVVAHVLERTRRQCERLTASVAAVSTQPAWFERLLQELVRDAVLDPVVEDLPDAEELDRRRAGGASLTRPELAVVLAGAKRWLAEVLLASDVVDQPGLRPFLFDSFPEPLSARFDHLLDDHPLRRELIASAVTNEIVDLLGMTFVHRVRHDTGAPAPHVAAAAVVASSAVDAPQWWPRLAGRSHGALDAPDAVDPRSLVVDLCEQLTRAELARMTSGGIDVAARVATLRPVVRDMALAMDRHASHDQHLAQQARVAALAGAGWPQDVASVIAGFPHLQGASDIADLCQLLRRPAADLVSAYAALDDRVGLVRLVEDVDALRLDDRWQQAAQQSVLDDLAALGRETLAKAVAAHPSLDGHRAVVDYLADREPGLTEALRFRDEARADPSAGLAGLGVAVRALRRTL